MEGKPLPIRKDREMLKGVEYFTFWSVALDVIHFRLWFNFDLGREKKYDAMDVVSINKNF